MDGLQTQVYYPMVTQLRVIASRLSSAFDKSDRKVSGKGFSVVGGDDDGTEGWGSVDDRYDNEMKILSLKFGNSRPIIDKIYR